MSDYATAVADLMRQRRDAGEEDVPLNLLILGRALDAMLPGKLEAKNGQFYIGSARMTGVADLYGTVGIPAVAFKQLLMVGDQSGLVSTEEGAAPALMVPFGIGALSPWIGAVNVEFLSNLAATWKDQIAASGLQSPDAVKSAIVLLSIGIIVVPETAERLTADRPRLAINLRDIPDATVGRRAAWYLIAEKLRGALTSYYGKQVAEAAAAVASAQRDVAFWDGVYTAVKAVRDAPATIAGAALDAAGKVFFRGPVIVLALIVAAGVGLWYFWPQIVGKVLSSRKAAAP